MEGANVDHMFEGARMYQDVVTYADFGIHRTGSEGDTRTANWLHEQLKEAGLNAELMEWNFDQFLLDECSLLVNGQSLESFPLYYPKVTGPEPIQAEMRKADKGTDLTGAIAVVHFDPEEDSIPAVARAGALAVILINNASSGLFSARNVVPYTTEPTVLPIVIIGNKDEDIIEKAIAKHQQARLSIQGRIKPNAVTHNVIGRINRGKRWIVVSTPISGWFTCGGERGAGVAVWLALARWAATLESGPSWLFIGNSGHEFHFLGMHHFLEKKDPPPPDQTLCWFHMGANVRVHYWKRVDGQPVKVGPARLAVHGVSPELQSTLESTIGGLSHARFTSRPIGELINVKKDGYSSFGLVASNFFFHHPDDTAASTSPELLEPVGLALKRAFKEIIRKDTIG